MRLPTAWWPGIADGVTKSWRHSGWRGRLGVASLAVCAALCAAVAALTVTPVAAGSSAVLVGLPVPTDQLPAIMSAATSCPQLSGPRLAAQIMVASKFNPDATTPGGGSGVAGLTAAEWQRWIPAPGDADRKSVV